MKKAVVLATMLAVGPAAWAAGTVSSISLTSQSSPVRTVSRIESHKIVIAGA